MFSKVLSGIFRFDENIASTDSQVDKSDKNDIKSKDNKISIDEKKSKEEKNEDYTYGDPFFFS